MKARFTHSSRYGRHSISEKDRFEVYERDNRVCQYCQKECSSDELSIDHLVPVALGGPHEIRNYVTCCRSCNSKKRHTPLIEFAKKINVKVEDLPVHGDPIIDNNDLPIEIRLIRKRIFESIRLGATVLTNKGAQKKIEKEFRTNVWSTEYGKELADRYPNLPGQVRIMIPEISTIAKSAEDFALLVELAKSASTRNLIGNLIKRGSDVVTEVKTIHKKTKDLQLQKRLGQALKRARL